MIPCQALCTTARMISAFLIACVAIAACGQVDMPVDLPCDDDACRAGEDSALSLRQLRGEMQIATERTEIKLNAHSTVKVNETAGVGPGTACVGESNSGWRTSFASHMYRCGLRHAGIAHSSGVCMASLQGVSLECGACLGQLISCGKGCMRECCAGMCSWAWGCKHCNKVRCNSDFEACAGVLL